MGDDYSELRKAVDPSNFAPIRPEEYIIDRGGIDPEKFDRWRERVEAEMRADPRKPKAAPMPVLFINGECLFRRQRVVVISGRAGSRKTSLLKLICSALEGSGLSPELTVPENEWLRGLYFDTEQSPDQTDKILNNILDATGKDFEAVGVAVYNLRKLPCTMIAPMIEQLVIDYKPDYIIIDNATDTKETIMDEAIAEEAALQFQNIAEVYNLCLIGVVHSNESRTDPTPRGWFGKVLLRRCSTHIHVTDKGDYSEVSFGKFRDGKPPEKFNICYDEERGLPRVGKPDASICSKAINKANPDKYAKIVGNIPLMGLSFTELRDEIIKNTGIAEKTAERWITTMKESKAVNHCNGRYYDPAKCNSDQAEELPF